MIIGPIWMLERLLFTNLGTKPLMHLRKTISCVLSSRIMRQSEFADQFYYEAQILGDCSALTTFDAKIAIKCAEPNLQLSVLW